MINPVWALWRCEEYLKAAKEAQRENDTTGEARLLQEAQIVLTQALLSEIVGLRRDLEERETAGDPIMVKQSRDRKADAIARATLAPEQRTEIKKRMVGLSPLDPTE